MTSDRHTDDEAQQTLDAIRSGNVDAVIVHGPNGPQLYHLESPDQPFRTFVERMQEGALTITTDGRVLYANQTFSRLVGVPIEEVFDEPISRFIAPGYHSTLLQLVRRGLNETVKLECRLRTRETTIPVQLTLSPLSETACCAVVVDLREREQAEEAHAARAAAEEASRAKDRFLAVLSHELRTPLNTILGWSEIFGADASLEPAARQAAQAIRRAAQTQAGLIGDLLDISRILAGKLHLERTELDPVTIAQSVVASMQPLVGDRRLVVSEGIGKGEAVVLADATRVTQILSNLLHNALKFTESGATIAVEVAASAAHVEISVTDDGIGMSDELLGRIFEVFQQGASSARRGGLGLGLSIARQLAEAHEGSLTAASDGEGRGSRFVLRLPRVQGSHRAPVPSHLARGALEGVHSLLVDDDPDSLELNRYLFERAGGSVTLATSAEQALELLEKESFDLVVSDVGLPGQDGLAMMREIRARGLTPEALPGIAVTGYAGVHDARLVSAAGYQRHVAKPIDGAGLVRAAADLARLAITTRTG